MAEVAVTVDAFLNGALTIRQPERGYRAGLDAVLLAAAVEPPAGARVLEPGCGVGVAALALAARRPDVSILGLEREPATADLARANAAANGMDDRVSVRTLDFLRERPEGGFDALMLNPPYNAPGHAPPEPRRRAAFQSEGDIDAWVKAGVDLLSGGGVFTLVHRAEAVPAILAALEGRLGGIELAPIRPHAGATAKRVLVRARKGSKAPFQLLDGLVLHEGSAWTPAANAILRGEAAFSWR